MIDYRLLHRFWSKVKKTDTCWLWIASLNEDGYGNFKFLGRVEKAHRVAWIITYGPISDGKQVLHSCDTTNCVNPSHLFLGNHLINMQDKVAKGRAYKPVGILSPFVKLREVDVIEIRKRLANGETQTSIATQFNCNQQNISNIKRRETWNHL